MPTHPSPALLPPLDWRRHSFSLHYSRLEMTHSWSCLCLNRRWYCWQHLIKPPTEDAPHPSPIPLTHAPFPTKVFDGQGCESSPIGLTTPHHHGSSLSPSRTHPIGTMLLGAVLQLFLKVPWALPSSCLYSNNLEFNQGQLSMQVNTGHWAHVQKRLFLENSIPTQECTQFRSITSKT